jgi:anti-sigma regulatory factor (Ser/Thr protein kinase)
MTRLHFQPIQGKNVDIINAILHHKELALVDEALYRKLYVVVDELVTNIVNYAYPNGENDYLDVEIMHDKELLTIRFRDGGVPFNPLEKAPSDITLPMDQRPIGGLGILLVVQKVDAIAYEYINGENVLTISFKITRIK